MAENIEILYDHYKDTFEKIEGHLARRDKYFIWTILSIIASVFATFHPSYVQDVTNNVSKTKLGIDLDLAFYTVNSVFVFLSLWYIMRYYQTVLIIENLYSYIHQVESKVSSLTKDFEITREGKSYLSSYPILKSCIHCFYSAIIPLAIVAASVIKIYWELFRLPAIPILSLICDVICLSGIFLLTVLFLLWMHFKDFRKSKDKEENKNGV